MDVWEVSEVSAGSVRWWASGRLAHAKFKALAFGKIGSKCERGDKKWRSGEIPEVSAGSVAR